MRQMTTADYPCGCRITVEWDDQDDPMHRKHTAVSDEDHESLRLERSGRPYHDGIKRKGCQEHWHSEHHDHLRRLMDHVHEPHPSLHLEWHDEGGYTVHIHEEEPKAP